LVQAWHNRYGFRQFGASTARGENDNGSRWLSASILVALTDPTNYPYQAIGAPYIEYEIDYNPGDQSYVRWFADRRVYTYDAVTRVITLVSTTREYLTDWIKFIGDGDHDYGEDSGWYVRSTVGPDIYYQVISITPYGEASPSSTRTTSISATMAYLHWDSESSSYVERYSAEPVSQASGITETLSNENTTANVLSILDTLLDGPWEDVDTATTGIDWDNQTYFDAELAHSGYYQVYYDLGTDDGLLQQIYIISGFTFTNYETKSNLWVGYTIDYPSSSAWPTTGGHLGNTPNPLLTKTRCRLRSSDAEIKLNRSNLKANGTDPLTNVIPYCDVVLSNDADELVYLGNETDADEVFDVCQTYTEIDAPSHVGNQAWYHVYL
jgi:hypothetical protein